jgi:hypothetical protein
MSFPEAKNNFEAGFSGVEVHDVFASQSPLKESLTFALEKPRFKKISDPRKKIQSTKPALPNNFFADRRGFHEGFRLLEFLGLRALKF